MKKLGKIQRDHFNAMTRLELEVAIADWEKQLGVIAGSNSAAADQKRAELQSRIDYCQKRLLVAKKVVKVAARKQAIIATPRKTDKGWLVMFACGHWKFMKAKPRNESTGLCTQCP